MKNTKFFAFFAIVAFVALGYVAHLSLASPVPQEGTFSFSPGTVKNGGTFYIKVTGAPASTPTKIWVDNGSGYVDFGGWVSTDASGNISATRTLNCSAYQTLSPGQTLPIGNKVLTQKVYLEYVGKGAYSPEATHTKDCTTETTSVIGGTADYRFYLKPTTGVTAGKGSTGQFQAMYDADGTGVGAAINVTNDAEWFTSDASKAVPTSVKGQYSALDYTYYHVTISAKYNGLVASGVLTIPDPNNQYKPPVVVQSGPGIDESKYIPIPHSVNESTVYCTETMGCRAANGLPLGWNGNITDPYTGVRQLFTVPSTLPMASYSAPIKRFVGRFLNSSPARDIQQPVRTYRARGELKFNFAEAKNRIYTALGSTFVAYDLSTFFTSDLGKPLVKQTDTYQTTPEIYLPFKAHVYPEEGGVRCEDIEMGQDPRYPNGGSVATQICYGSTGWWVVNVDGQDRLGDFDYDDRGYIYLAYGPFDWGIVRDEGGTGVLPLVRQYVSHSVSAGQMRVLKVNDRYYLAIIGLGKTDIYDVTDPANATFVRTLFKGGERNYLKISGASEDKIIFWSQNTISIYNASAYISGAGSSKSITVPEGTLTNLVTDGTNFFVTRFRNVLRFPGTGAADTWQQNDLIVASPSASGYDLKYYPLSTKTGVVYSLDYHAGYLTLLGSRTEDNNNIKCASASQIVCSGGTDLRLFKVSNAVPTEVSLGHFFRNFYFDPPEGYANPGQYTTPEYAQTYSQNGKTYLIIGTYSLGDVYEIEPSGVTPTPTPTPTPIPTPTPTPTPIPSGGGGGGTISIPPAPPSDDQCFNEFRTYCDTIIQLRQAICKLAPELDMCAYNPLNQSAP